ncbi:MAG: nicotinate-nucleotide adenylyltransferase [Acidobacteriota bacterium]|nr:nicotinic acid mononucleotide adenylyltransferase [Acidobacteriota bacterium]MEC8944112.1 nicotinate-nucleotide adenylyltransferase [Acidobacteriota bacterium]|tara:strand:- start:9418 stop:10119 length:702 start_codon:yes stop_codon:yes gene_type:complete
MSVERVGVFGGTFDPPHLGHLILAEEIRERFGLVEMYFMPCNQPPHKDSNNLTEAKHRFAMVVAATLHNPGFVVSSIEANRKGKSFSIDTVRQLQEHMGDEVQIVFVTGIDAFINIETWKDHREFLDLCHIVVVSRPGHGFEEVAKMPTWISDRVVDLREGDLLPQEQLEQCPDGEWHVFLSDAVHIDISSTEIRERVAARLSVRYKVPDEVDRYIRANGLYRSAGKPRETAS